MPSIAPIAAQGLGGLGALALALFCPQPGSASVLVPLGGANEAAVADWAAREQAQLVAFDPAARRISVIAPTTLSLVRALSYGLLPIAAGLPPCGSEVATSRARTDEQG